MKRLYVVLAGVVAAILAATTAIAGLGPESEPQIGARELPTKLAYGDRGRPDAPAPAAAAGVKDLPTPKADGLPASVPAPGVLPTPARSPVPRGDAEEREDTKTTEEDAAERPAADAPAPVPPVPATASESCPPAGSASPDAAPLTVGGVPAAGTYRFRQTGRVRGREGVRDAAPLIDRVFEPATQPSRGVRRYDVRVTEGGATSVTTFEVDTRGVDDGVFLVATRSSDLDALNFVPALRVKLLPLPAVAGTTFASVGTDPLTGSSMVVNGRVIGRDEVDACGTLVSGWRVAFESGSLSLGPDGQQTFTGTMLVATGAGGAIVQEDLETTPVGGGEPAKRTTTAAQAIPQAA